MSRPMDHHERARWLALLKIPASLKEQYLEECRVDENEKFTPRHTTEESPPPAAADNHRRPRANKLVRDADGLQVLPLNARLTSLEGGAHALYKPLVAGPTRILHTNRHRINYCRNHLKARFPWAHRAVDMALDKLELQVSLGLTHEVRLPNLLFAGPTGSGKSRFATELARGLRTATLTIFIAEDPRSVSSTAAGWGSRTPHPVLSFIAHSHVANPIVVLEEIDKVDANAKHNGNALDSLLPLLESDTAQRFYDTCLRLPANLSRVSWLATANSTAKLPPQILSRFAVVPVPTPNEMHVDTIVHTIRHDMAKQLDVHVQLLPELIDERSFLANRLRRGSSLRAIQRMVEHLVLRGLRSSGRNSIH